MKLLLISDEEDRYLWDHYQPGCLSGIDMILSGVQDSAGDVNRDGEVGIADVNTVIDIILQS